MRTVTWVLPILFIAFPLLTVPAFSQQKLAQTGMKFLNVSTDARAVSLGEAMTAVESNSSALFFNPACMARLEGVVNASLGEVSWIADIKHNYLSAAVSPAGGEYGVLGVMVQYVDYGDILMTVKSGSAQGYEELGTFSPSGRMIGLGYARALSDKFAVGAAAKWVEQNLGEGVVSYDATGNAVKQGNKANTFAFDFGLTYRTGFKSLSFGMVVRNFAKEVRYINEGFQLPLTFRVGASMNILDLTSADKDMHRFLLTIDAEHPRDFAERIKVGGEYVFMNLLFLRAGFISRADEQKFSYGAGVYKALGPVGLGVDFAYTPYGLFGDVTRLSIQFSWI